MIRFFSSPDKAKLEYILWVSSFQNANVVLIIHYYPVKTSLYCECRDVIVCNYVLFCSICVRITGRHPQLSDFLQDVCRYS